VPALSAVLLAEVLDALAIEVEVELHHRGVEAAHGELDHLGVLRVVGPPCWKRERLAQRAMAARFASAGGVG
jgi:hypothetical protein